jgi:hypothetical protein
MKTSMAMNLPDESDTEVLREIGVHGAKWERLHGGYFSDSDVVSCLVKEIRKSIEVSNPDIIVDLAGGTGYVLRELIRSNIDPRVRLVNIDLSGRQLYRTKDPRITTLRKSISNFRRDDIRPGAERLLFVMRSAFHYFGRERLLPLLGHLRSQMRNGEMFVHQTASFAFRKDVFCMNMLYELMGTAKWFPTVREMRKLLRNEGWSIAHVSRAPKLLLTSEELAGRYNLSGETVKQISEDLFRRNGEIENVFAKSPDGFRACLHYYIYRCVAV